MEPDPSQWCSMAEQEAEQTETLVASSIIIRKHACRGCGVSILGDIQKTSGHSAMQPALGNHT